MTSPADMQKRLVDLLQETERVARLAKNLATRCDIATTSMDWVSKALEHARDDEETTASLHRLSGAWSREFCADSWGLMEAHLDLRRLRVESERIQSELRSFANPSPSEGPAVSEG